MNRSFLFGYQILTGTFDISTGIVLMITPALTVQLLHLEASSSQFAYLSLIGAFVLSVGLSCLYGAFVAYRGGGKKELEVVWLLTAFTRTSVAIFVTEQVLANVFSVGWITVAAFDGVCVLIQAVGLRKGWLASAA